MIIKGKKDLIVLNTIIIVISVSVVCMMLLPAISSYVVSKYDKDMEKDLVVYEEAFEKYKEENNNEVFKVEGYNSYLPKEFSFEKSYSVKKSPYGYPYEIEVSKYGNVRIKTKNTVPYSKFFYKN